MAQLKPFKAPGPDGIHNILLKHLPMSALLLLVTLFNFCVDIGHWPKSFKLAKVIALPKVNKDRKCPENYRPISLLNAMGKVFERILLRRILAVAEAKNLNRCDQFGFKASHSTVHQLMRVKNHISACKAQRKSTGLLMMDFEKAFDTIWHDGLIFKLHKFGFPHHLLKLIHGFCIDRKFQVHTNQAVSQCVTMMAGLGQGAVLSPHLFSLYIADIILPSNVLTAFYADDTAILASANRGNTIVRRLQAALNVISQYMDNWKIKVNSSKTQFVLFPYNGSRRRLPTLPLQLRGTVLPMCSKATYLGVILDAKLNFKAHLESAKMKAMACLRAVYPLIASKSKLSSANKYLIFKCVIRPILLYASPVWDSAHSRFIKNLQIVQNKCLKTIIRAPRRFPTGMLHDITNMQTINEYLEDFKVQFLQKCTNSNFSLIREIAN